MCIYIYIHTYIYTHMQCIVFHYNVSYYVILDRLTLYRPVSNVTVHHSTLGHITP